MLAMLLYSQDMLETTVRKRTQITEDISTPTNK
jgi:hypothetical protein